MEFLRAFGEAVKAERSRRGVSQEELGHLADLDRTYVSGLERGRRNPTLVTQRRLAIALDVRLSALVRAAERLTDQ